VVPAKQETKYGKKRESERGKTDKKKDKKKERNTYTGSKRMSVWNRRRSSQVNLPPVT
jgi:hypothetical protein